MSHRRVLSLLAALLAAAAVVGGVAVLTPGHASAVSAGPVPQAQQLQGSVILVGTGGLGWSDVTAEQTPAVWSLLQDGSGAAMTIRSVFTNTCPLDGWLGLSAGARAAGPGPAGSAQRAPSDPCPAIPAVKNGAVQGWSTFVTQAADRRFDANLGLIGDEAAKAGLCVQAIGPGAAVAAATSAGKVANARAFKPASLMEDLATCPITIVDVGSIRDPDDVADGEPKPSATRAAQLTALDDRIDQVLQAAPNGANLILGSLADAGMSERLRLAIAKGPAYGPGTLNSPSTRQPGLIQAQDLTSTLLGLAHLEVPASLGGAVLERDPVANNSVALTRDRLRTLADYDQASHEVHSLVPPFFNAVVYGQIVIYGLVALLWRSKIGSEGARLRALRLVRIVAVAAAAVPVSTFLANLVPWWRGSHPMLAVVGVVAACVVVIAAVALFGPWGRTLFGPLVIVTLTTLIVLTLDVFSGSRLQLSSLMGLQPVIGGRYYGFGNVTFAIFGTAALLLATAIANRFLVAHHKILAAAAVLIIGGAAVVVDGSPLWGADGGGPPALIPAIGYLTLAVLGLKMTLKRGVIIGLGTVATFFAVAFLDWLRPPQSRTHLGRFIQAIQDGQAWDIVVRKAQQNLDILFGEYRLALLVPIALGFVIYTLARPTSWGSQALQRSFDRAPALRPGLIAVVIMLTIGFLANDSGVAIPAVGATIAVPFVIATAVKTLKDDLMAQSSSRAGRRGRRRDLPVPAATAPPT